MSKTIKKVLLSLFAGIVILISIAPSQPAKAADTWYSSGFPSWYAKVYNDSNPNEIFGERYTAAQVQWVTWGLLANIVNAILYASGCSTTPLVALFSGNASNFDCRTTTLVPNQPNTASGKNQNMLSAVFADRAFSGVTYVKDFARKFHIIPQAKAQSSGFGYTALDPVLPLWQAARNTSYVLFVIVILILSFMIMFRVKISPQVVVSVQSALPKIAIGLVLVTFSYAIAGFLIDLMYVVIGLISIIFASTNMLNSTNPVVLFGYLTTGFYNTGIFGFLILYFVQFLATFLVVSIAIVNSVIGSFNTALPGGTGFAVGLFAGGGIAALFVLIAIILFIALFIILLIMAVKILITLIKAFAYIMFLTIILPLQITFGIVVPSIGFGTWVRQFISNLAIFPITGLLFFLSFVFMEQARVFAQNNVNFDIIGGLVKAPSTNPSFNAGWPPLLGVSAGGVAMLFLVASFFIISMVPKAAEVASAIINGKGNFGSAIGEATGPVRGLANEGFASLNATREYDAKAAGKSPFDLTAGAGGRSAQISYAVKRGLQEVIKNSR